jgi:O-antigen/teichoic acid export membrane protein
MPHLKDRQIARNTLLLYARMVIILIAGLFISRTVLAAMGVTDFGIYSAVEGAVALFAFLNGALSGATQRFITFELGQGNRQNLQKVFSSSIQIHAGLALCIFLVAEIAGLHLLNARMNITPARLAAANTVFHCSLLSLAINLVTIPYPALITAHERMKTIALTGILDILLKLGIALLIRTGGSDKLTPYAILLLAETVAIQAVYVLYCRKRFPETRYRFVADRKILRRICIFAGWSIVGNIAHSLRGGGVTIILNLLCGAAVNAARALSLQIGNALNILVLNFLAAVSPQITKSFAAGDLVRTQSLVNRASRYSFYLLAVIALPVYINMERLLNLWLENVPEHTAAFLRLTIPVILIDSMAAPITTAIQATGKVRDLNLAVGAILALDLPLAWLVLKAGAMPHTILYVSIATATACLFVRLIILKRYIPCSLRRFFLDIFLPNILLALLAAAILLQVKQLFLNEPPPLLLMLPLCSIFTCTAIYTCCLTKSEREFLRKKIAEYIPG